MRRVEWIDRARAIGIVAIVMGHALRGASIYWWLYSFHVPLFVVLSGYLFHGSKKENPFSQVLMRKTKSLLIPYWAFSVVSILFYTALGKIAAGALNRSVDETSMISKVVIALYGNAQNGIMTWNLPLWYLPCIFATEVIAYLLFKRLYKGKSNMIALCGISLVISIIIAASNYYLFKIDYLPFSLETAVYLFPLFIVGMMVSESKMQKLLSNCGVLLSLAISSILIVFGAVSAHSVDYVCDSYGNYFVFLLSAISTSLGIMTLCRMLPKMEWLQYIGKHTLAILVMHKFPLLFFQTMLPVTKKMLQQYPLPAGVMITIASISMCLIAEKIILAICPILLGQTIKKRVKNTM
ncbi:MAG: acyltransferase family protein [Ruthenibacterium sp.]